MTYQIEFQDVATNAYCWFGLEVSYPSEEEAQRAINDLIARGGRWSRCAYRVSRSYQTAPTHAELARLLEHHRNLGAMVAF